jgi:hypothetical protein
MPKTCKYGERVDGKCPKKPAVQKPRITKRRNASSAQNVENPNWDSVSSKKEIEHNGKKYTVIVIPENTYVYRGFEYGDDPSKEPPGVDISEIVEYNTYEYNKRKNAGIYYANLAVACYYAYNPDRGYKWKHVVVEYKTVKPLQILDMTVWQNLKNVVDDVPELESVFESTHGFNAKKPKKKLTRFSGGLDDEMTDLMREWLQSNPAFDGFGHLIMPGLHSEFTCVDRTNLTEMNEFVSDNYKSREMVNPANNQKINLENLSLVDGVKKRPFRIVSLLKK